MAGLGLVPVELLRAGFLSSEGGPIKLKALPRLKWEGRERVLASDSFPPSETCCLLKQVPSLLCVGHYSICPWVGRDL